MRYYMSAGRSAAEGGCTAARLDWSTGALLRVCRTVRPYSAGLYSRVAYGGMDTAAALRDCGTELIDLRALACEHLGKRRVHDRVEELGRSRRTERRRCAVQRVPSPLRESIL